MYKSYFKIGWRSILRNRSYSFINISGLALGISCAIIIFSIVSYHLSFDNFHHDSERIYRFVTEQHRDQINYSGSVPPAFGNAFREDYTFGEKVARLCTVTDMAVTVYEGDNVNKFKEDVSFAEPEFFDIFNFPVASGQRSNLLREPNTALISERIAKKYFGEESAINKTFRFDNQIDFTISAVLKNNPDNTDLRSEIYLSYANINTYNEWYAADDSWGGITGDIQTFTRLQPGVAPAEVEAVLPAYVKKYRAESKNVHHYKLQPLNDIHLNARYGGIPEPILWVLSVIGFFLISTACLNFVNLATAQAINRSKEVGIRKTLGGLRGQLFWQFITETGVIVILATLAAFCSSYFVLPLINELFQANVSLDLFFDFKLLFFSLLLVLVVTFLSGFYPGLVLSGFKPVQALKGKNSDQRGGSYNVRRALIISQFVISQVLLIGLIVIVYQVKYFRQSDLGFNRDAIVMIPTGSGGMKKNTLKEQFIQIPNVENVSLCFGAPASFNRWSTTISFDNRREAETFAVSFKAADERYLSTFDIDLVAGRNLTPSDTIKEFLVNEKLVQMLGFSSPEDILGKMISSNGGDWKGPVVGVVQNFHDQSLRSDISPVFMASQNEFYNAYAVKLNMSDAPTTLASLEKGWSSMYPEKIYEYDFLDNQIAAFYKIEETMLKLVEVFACIALFVGCMGLYGLVSFMAVQKTKEIGIRKVLGGNIVQILWIFGKEFSRLVIIAFLFAAPVSWWIMTQWLENYAYSITITPWIFVLEIVIIFLIVLLTVGYKSFKTAIANPINSLRTE